jgi:hypothetical protein
MGLKPNVCGETGEIIYSGLWSSVLVFVSFCSCISLCPTFIARLAQGWSVIGVGHITVDDFDAGGRLHPSTYPVPSHLINPTVSARVLFILELGPPRELQALRTTYYYTSRILS